MSEHYLPWSDNFLLTSRFNYYILWAIQKLEPNNSTDLQFIHAECNLLLDTDEHYMTKDYILLYQLVESCVSGLFNCEFLHPFFCFLSQVVSDGKGDWGYLNLFYSKFSTLRSISFFYTVLSTTR